MRQELGRYFDADAVHADKLAQDHPLLAACCTAWLLGVDTLSCEKCGHTPMRVISVICTPSPAQLAAISNPALQETASLWPRPSRAPPTGQMQFAFTRKAA